MNSRIIITGLLALSLQACAENPEKLVSPSPKPIGGGLPVIGQPITTNAIHFKGLDLNDDPCDVFLTFHDNSWLLKLGYILHGETFPDMIVNEYDYDSSSKQYDSIKSTGINHTPVLAAAILDDPNATIDLNKLGDYRSNGTLKYSIQLNLDSNLTFNEFESFEDAIIQIENDETLFTANESKLNVVDSITFRLKHNGHYDTARCTGLVAEGVDEMTFSQVVGDSDDHDHDHDHDDDHDDDHIDDPVVVNP